MDKPIIKNMSELDIITVKIGDYEVVISRMDLEVQVEVFGAEGETVSFQVLGAAEEKSININ